MSSLYRKYYLFLAVNPLSDSAAATTIYRIIRQLDVLSGEDVKIYLPGFREVSKEHSTAISQFEESNKQIEYDYHGKNPIYHTSIPSHGELVFNDVDFAKFMLDLEEYCPQFEYLGMSQLLLIPASKGKILYEDVISFNLEYFFTKQGDITIESFLLNVLKLMKRYNKTTNVSLLSEIDNLYNSCFKINESTPEEVKKQVDNDIISHMHWQNTDKIFFISYSTKDELDAETLKELLVKKGQNVWMAPDGIPVGYDYACVIPAAVRISSRFLVLLSKNSAQSDWVRREITQAISKKKRMDGIFLNDFNADIIKTYDHLSLLLDPIQMKYHLDDFMSEESILTEFIK